MFEKHPPMVPVCLLLLALFTAQASAGEFDLLDARLSEAVMEQIEAQVLPELVETMTRDLEYAIAKRQNALRRERLVLERKGSSRPASLETSGGSPRR